ncbi:hypothetical protein BN7_2726 [Wickerhamomyces ciferrii]|uniref:LAA1-like C-terminal TPR repeats domain-containing protein n=1 Tax=Wickerhamomyces ciferrii (strain ATCC 14091 / BCRC 22168 / CBS 111 / JCM 3599 / NBRC 0793 / NRRL Y-1031 F-60-10) TaxID=1206466 RepID=K0KP65_WICCF|nr:uncharacterized protein BN7_2726 [Wickerhamomyces ciferrii]CCH43179.1 hypothetical protein BN7_2726 [Wickerhamomyces ciferrii]
MDIYNSDSLIPLINNDNINTLLLTYHTNLYQYLSNNPISKDSIKYIDTQFNKQLEYLTNNQDKLALLSQQIIISIAKNYTAILKISSNSLFDTTNKFIQLITDSKKSEFTPLKNYSCIILSYIYEQFGHDLVSFTPLLISIILKHLKKQTNGKHLINLSKLLSNILRNGGVIDDSLQSKFNKYFKTFITTQNTSIILIQNLFESWSIISNLKKHADYQTYQLSNNQLLITGLSSHKSIRISTANALAESLTLSTFNKKQIWRILVDLYIEGDLKVKIGILETIIQFNNLQTVQDLEYFRNEFEEFFGEFHMKILNHEKSSDLNHLITLYTHLFKFQSESIKKQILDKLFTKLSQDDLSSLKLISILQLIQLLINSISILTTSDLEIYQISLLKLSSSPELEIRINSIKILKIMSKNSPNLINDLLSNSFNELSNNLSQTSEQKLNFNKTNGLALIISDLIQLSNKDYISLELILKIWDFLVLNFNQQKKVKDQIYYYIQETCWIIMIGIFNYKDLEFLNSKKLEFLGVWNQLTTLDLNDDTNIELEYYKLSGLLNFIKNFQITSNEAINFEIYLNSQLESLQKLNNKESTNLLNKKILECYLILLPILKTDLNSLLLIQSIKNFAQQSTLLTTKFKGYEIDELLIKFNDQDIKTTSTDYSIDFISRPKNSIESSHIKSWISKTTWIDELESILINPVESSVLNDPLSQLISSYSQTLKFPPQLNLSIIDVSIEIFSLGFPMVSTKIQLSLLENLRSLFLTKGVTKECKQSIGMNCSIALHGVLNISHQQGLKFSKEVGLSILEILTKIYEEDSNYYLLNLNSRTLGLVISNFDKIDEFIKIYINKIINNSDSNSRSFNSQILAQIYENNQSQFNEIWEILIKLIQDPHPVVHSWSLDSLSLIINKKTSLELNKISKLILVLEDIFISDKYGLYNDSISTSNLNSDLDSNKVLSQILRKIITNLGPNFKELESDIQKKLINLILNLGEINDPVIQCELIKLYQELIIYQPGIISIQWILKKLEFNFQNNIWDFLQNGELFPVNSSFKILGCSLDLLYQLIKTNDDLTILNELEYLIWILLDIYPYSILINKLISTWIDSTINIEWFNKLNHLFNISKKKLYQDFHLNFKKIIDKYKSTKKEIELNDEESQSIAQNTQVEISDDKDNESTNWEFKSKILKNLTKILEKSTKSPKLYHQLSIKISDLIKISIQSSNSPLLNLRILGIELLGDIIHIFAPAPDPIYPEMSLLEQRQAQITSALIPAFQEDSNSLVASRAIKIIAEFIGLKIVKINRLGRISRILIDSLKELYEFDESHDEDFKINEVIISNTRDIKKIKLSILNAWAELKILSFKNNDLELNELIDEYLDSLIPLWCSTLKNFIILKNDYNLQNIHQDLELFQGNWINLVNVIGVIIEIDEFKIDTLFQKDCFGFFYMLYAQILSSLIQNDDLGDQTEKLIALSKILNYKKLVELILHDDIFGESIEVFERLILTGSLSEQTEVLNITSKIFLNFFNTYSTNHELEQYVDKLFELVRVNIQVILRLVPYLQHDNKRIIPKKEEEEGLSNEELVLLKKAFELINKMLGKFPDMIKIDLYSSLLSLLISIYQEGETNKILKNQIIPTILPILKTLLKELVEMNDIVTINNFFQTIKKILLKTDEVTEKNLLLTIGVVLNTSNEILKLNNEDIEIITNFLSQGLINDLTITISTQSIKSIILNKKVLNSIISKSLLPKMINQIIDSKIKDPRVSIELIILVLKQSNEQIPIYTILLPILIFINDKSPEYNGYLHKKLISLIQLNPQVFKTVINEILSSDQRFRIEKLVKFEGEVEEEESVIDHGQIQLKTFE